MLYTSNGDAKCIIDYVASTLLTMLTILLTMLTILLTMLTILLTMLTILLTMLTILLTMLTILLTMLHQHELPTSLYYLSARKNCIIITTVSWKRLLSTHCSEL